MINFRFSTLIFGALLCLFSLSLNAQGFSILIDSAEVQAGQNVCLKVKSKGFVDLVSFQFSLTWNAQILQYIGIKNPGLPGWSASDFISVFSNNNLLVGWSNPAGTCFSKSDGETLFEVCFTAIGAPGSFSLVTAGSDGFPPSSGFAEAYNCFGQNIWYPMGNDTGLITIVAFTSAANSPKNEVALFQVIPNPTQTASNVVFQAQTVGNARLLVTDALGRTVFAQKIFVNAGENKIEIPAKALNSKGLYQVSVQTDKGVSAQMLCVN